MDSELKQLKTGTTILGIVCKDGVVMAGDNRSSIGQSIIFNKSSDKVYPLNEYLVFAGCGSATEAQKVGKLLTAELKLRELKSKQRPTVRQSASLLSNIQVEASAYILAGFDKNGKASLYEITGGHLTQVEDYTASVGSGMPYSLGFLERSWKSNLTIDEGVNLAIESLKASTARDMASGNGMDIYTITKDGIKKVISQRAETVYKNKE